MRKRIIAALVALGLVAVLLPVRAGNPTGAVYSTATDRIFWFVHASDIHVGMRGSNDTTRLSWLVTTGKSVIAPSFMVVTGDLTDSTNGSLLGIPNGPYQAEWDSYKSILAGKVDTNFYYDLPGNHDAYNDKNFAYYLANSVQGQATHATQISWTKTFPFGTYHFLGVNSCDNTGAPFSLLWPYGDYAGLDDGELGYINAQLAANAAANLTFVFGHHPVTDTGASDDTWLYYGHQPFISALDSYRASFYGYGHTHDQSDVQFAGNGYTGTMTNGGIRYENIASVGKSSANNYDIVAVDCDGVSSVPATIGTWPVVLITAPVAKALGSTVNPFAYKVPAASANPVRALVFDAVAPTSVAFKVDAETTWHAMTPVAGSSRLWQGVWNASSLASGDHTLVVQAVGSSTRSHSITVTVEASTANRAPAAANDAYSVDQGSSLSVSGPGVLANDADPDGDPITAVLVSTTPNGALVLNADGGFTYSPKAGFSGADSFTYRASDGSLASDTATVSIVVNAAATDVVTIKTASYSRKTGTLTVQATSSAQPTVSLTVVGYGAMTYNTKLRYYALSLKTSPAPATVTVTSSGGGEAAKRVTVK
jgi:hypothetical protein